MSDHCIFCSILRGDLSAEIVDQDEHTVALMDISPWTRGHALVVPRRHSRNLYEIDDSELAHAAIAARRLALKMKQRLDCDGVNLLNACEPAAWQSVWHFHIHVLPRYADDSLQIPSHSRVGDADAIASVAADLRS